MWRPDAMSGPEPPTEPMAGEVTRDIGDGVVLALAGGRLSSEDQTVLDAFAAQLSVAAESSRLQEEADRASDLRATNDLRAALLQAVSHDLRTPLASIKASISSLRQRDIDWPGDVVDEFQTTIEEETDRLSTLVANLLDMSRLQASAVTVELRPVGIEEVALAAVASLGGLGSAVEIDVEETLPELAADPALLERALANLITNAVRHSPPDVATRVTAGVVRDAAGERVDIRVIDCGPGIPVEDRELVFQPFQRRVDHQADGTGVGLGLAIARGFVQAMGGTLTVEDTPGGGTTMVVGVPHAERGGVAAGAVADPGVVAGVTADDVMRGGS